MNDVIAIAIYPLVVVVMQGGIHGGNTLCSIGTFLLWNDIKDPCDLTASDAWELCSEWESPVDRSDIAANYAPATSFTNVKQWLHLLQHP